MTDTTSLGVDAAPAVSALAGLIARGANLITGRKLRKMHFFRRSGRSSREALGVFGVSYQTTASGRSLLHLLPLSVSHFLKSGGCNAEACFSRVSDRLFS